MAQLFHPILPYPRLQSVYHVDRVSKITGVRIHITGLRRRPSILNKIVVNLAMEK
jgi:hypothetical protein